jgi:hypothetical protein
MKLIEINYSNLQGGDMVHCAGRSPFAAITRIVTAGFKDITNYNISVHTGIIVDFYGQKLIAEMQPGGLEINSLEKYAKVGDKRWIIDITRNPIFNDVSVRTKLQEQIAIDRRRTIEYDYKGLLEFVFKKTSDDKSKNYCSEYVYYLTRCLSCKYPREYSIKVSPVNLQFNSPGWASIDWRIDV